MPTVLQFDAVGERHQLVFREVAAAMPAPREVRLKVCAYALNQADLLFMRGRHYAVASLPARIGYEACGIVEAVGAQVTRFRAGDRVSTIPNVDGPYLVAGEFALAHEDFLSVWPDGFSDAQACAFWMQYLTAYFPLKESFAVGAGDWVLITAASSSAGLGALRVAKLLGANTIATSRTQAKRGVLLDSGADAVIATDHEPLAERVLDITAERGVRVVNDTIGGSFVARYVEALAEHAHVYVHGALLGEMEVKFPILALVRKAASLHGYSLINHTRDSRALARGKRFVTEALASGSLPPPRIDRIFGFDQAIEAYEYMESGAQVGKIVVRVAAD